MANLPVLLLTTRGRKSGKRRTVPLCYLPVPGSNGRDPGFAIVASYGGSPVAPAWYFPRSPLSWRPGASAGRRPETTMNAAVDAVVSAQGLRKQYKNKAALDGNFTVLATGHNLDDEISRLFSNVLRWDYSYLADQGPSLPAANGFARKVKPLFRLTEFETANYAFLKGIDWHYAPCPYSPGATFTFYKTLWSSLEEHMPGRKLDFYLGFLKQGKAAFMARQAELGVAIAPCQRCHYPTSSEVCGVCHIRESLE